VHPMEPAESPTLTTGHKVGKHRIQGVSDEFIPDIVCLNTLDNIICVNDGDGIIMAQMLSSELGLSVGISSGANFISALKVRQNMAQNGQQNAKVVTIFCDDAKKYLSTDLTKVEPIKEGYLSTDIQLIGYEVFRICKDLFRCIIFNQVAHIEKRCLIRHPRSLRHRVRHDNNAIALF